MESHYRDTEYFMARNFGKWVEYSLDGKRIEGYIYQQKLFSILEGCLDKVYDVEYVNKFGKLEE